MGVYTKKEDDIKGGMLRKELLQRLDEPMEPVDVRLKILKINPDLYESAISASLCRLLNIGRIKWTTDELLVKV